MKLDTAQKFVADMVDVLDNPAARTVLRRGVNLDVAQVPTRMHAYLIPWTEHEAETSHRARTLYMIASLMAIETKTTQPPPANLGVSLATASVRKVLAESTTQRLLTVLCRQRESTVHRHVARTVRILRSEGIGVDWVRLTCDVDAWPWGGDRVAARWARDYYRATLTNAARKQIDALTDAPTTHPADPAADTAEKENV